MWSLSRLSRRLLTPSFRSFARVAPPSKPTFKDRQQIKQQLKEQERESESVSLSEDEEEEVEFQDKHDQISFQQLKQDKQKNKLKFLKRLNDQEIQYENDSSSDFEEEFAEQVKSHPFGIRHEEEGKEIVLKYDDELDKKMDKDTMKFVQDTLMYTGEDSMPQKLVNRPIKGVVWGLGGELLKQQDNFFRKDRAPLLEEIIEFLQLEQCKDITVTDLHEYDKFDMAQYGVVCTTFSCRHNTRVAKNLQKQINNLQLEKNHLRNKVSVSGRKDDEWVMISIGEVMVHLFNEDMRHDFDIESRWKDVDHETAELHEKLTRKRKGKAMFEPFEDLL